MKAQHLPRAALFPIFACGLVSAQVTSGTIPGRVVDPTDRGVAGATLTITDLNAGTTKTITTDETGNYNVLFLPIGTYRITAESSGCKRSASGDSVLNVDDERRVDFKLEVGNVSESTTVEAPLIRAESGEPGEVINRTSVSELPLNGRDFAQLVYLVPGVTAGQPGENPGGSSTFNPRAGSNFNALGEAAFRDLAGRSGLRRKPWRPARELQCERVPALNLKEI